jgi:hypothetical protein
VNIPSAFGGIALAIESVPKVTKDALRSPSLPLDKCGHDVHAQNVHPVTVITSPRFSGLNRMTMMMPTATMPATSASA